MNNLTFTPAVGQRWLWTVADKSNVVIEITAVSSSDVSFIYVQVIAKGYREDYVGNKSTEGLEYFSSSELTYLAGQDRAQ